MKGSVTRGFCKTRQYLQFCNFRVTYFSSHWLLASTSHYTNRAFLYLSASWGASLSLLESWIKPKSWGWSSHQGRRRLNWRLFNSSRYNEEKPISGKSNSKDSWIKSPFKLKYLGKRETWKVLFRMIPIRKEWRERIRKRKKKSEREREREREKGGLGREWPRKKEEIVFSKKEELS